MEQLLNDPNLSDATLRFCDHIVSNYSFSHVLEGALKRAAWHHSIPALAQVEAEALDDDFYMGLISYLKNPKTSENNLCVKAIPELGRRVHEVVRITFSKT